MSVSELEDVGIAKAQKDYGSITNAAELVSEVESVGIANAQKNYGSITNAAELGTFNYQTNTTAGFTEPIRS